MVQYYLYKFVVKEAVTGTALTTTSPLKLQIICCPKVKVQLIDTDGIRNWNTSLNSKHSVTRVKDTFFQTDVKKPRSTNLQVALLNQMPLCKIKWSIFIQLPRPILPPVPFCWIQVLGLCHFIFCYQTEMTK